MTITIEVTPTFTLIIYPELDQVVWIFGGANKKTCVTDLMRAEVELRAEYSRRMREVTV